MKRMFKSGHRIRTMAVLFRELEARWYVFLNTRLVHWRWLRSMTYQTLSSFIYGGKLRKAEENSK